MKFGGLGQPVERVEDKRLTTGRGRYTDDIALPRQLRAYILRSPHAHATIRSIDTRDAEAAPAGSRGRGPPEGPGGCLKHAAHLPVRRSEQHL